MAGDYLHERLCGRKLDCFGGRLADHLRLDECQGGCVTIWVAGRLGGQLGESLGSLLGGWLKVLD